jgi:hypothetical protein
VAPKEEAIMTGTNYLDWFRRLLVLGAVVAAGAMAAGAGAAGRPPDVQDAAAANLAALIDRPPDVRDATSGTSVSVPDVFERYATAHPYGRDSSLETIVPRPPDIADAALTALTPSFGLRTGFDWGDWGIGIGTGAGLVLILGSGLIVGRQLRHRSVRTA